MLNGQRGQTIPFWLVATVVLLSLIFFLSNYLNVMAWHIRAQNAADSAAAVVLSPSTNVLNQESTMLYAQAVNEYRLRYLNQGMLNAINGIGCTTAGGGCQAAYSSLLTEYNAALGAYNDMNQAIQQANNYTQGGQQAADEKAAAKLIGQGVSDPAFTYTTFDTSAPSGKKSGIRQIDIGACHTVAFFTPALLGLTNGAGFDALGRAAAISRPSRTVGAAPAGWFLASAYSEYFNPGSGTNPLTNAAYQPPEDPVGTNNAAYVVDFSNLTVGLSWYISSVIQPYSGVKVKTKDYSCAQ